MVFKKTVLVLALAVYCATAREIVSNDIAPEPEVTIYSDASFKPFLKCSFSSDFVASMTCAAARALKIVNEINKKPNLQILPGVTLTSDETYQEGKQAEELVLPSDPKAKTIALMEHLLDGTAKLVTSRSINVKFPETQSQSLSRALEEGRGKMKKMMMPLLFGMAAKMGIVFPFLTAAVGLLASKALVVSKIALGLVLALLIPTVFGSGNSFGFLLQNMRPYHGNSGGWNTGYYPSGSYGAPGPSYGAPSYGFTTNQLGGGPYARTFTVDDATSTEESSGENLAYSAYAK